MESFAIPGAGGIFKKIINGAVHILSKNASNEKIHKKVVYLKYLPERSGHLKISMTV